MLDQSFSHENFRIILDVENRRGKYIEDNTFFKDEDIFKESRNLTDSIIELNKLIRVEKRRLPSKEIRKEKDYEAINKIQKDKEYLEIKREEARVKILQVISSNINENSYKLIVEKSIVKYGKQLYIAENTPENFFVLKQLQRNIYKTFSAKQSNRKIIISQLKLSLDDNFPKVVVRTDIKSYYESIPHRQLIARIDENSLLSYTSKSIIKDILNQYWKILVSDGIKKDTDERVGVPRGLGISAYLSELYLSDFDKAISSLANVTYYARYVDDIVVIFTPNNRTENRKSQYYKERIEKIINKHKLLMNTDKTSVYDFRKSSKDRKTSKKYEINYLGYKFIISYKKKLKEDKPYISKEKNQICMSDAKLERNKNKIKEAFINFEKNIVRYSDRERKTNKLLIQRIKILTHNFQLYRRKSFVFVGIYFSNEFLTSESDLKILDELLKTEINRVSHLLSNKTKDTVKKYSFRSGFRDKTIVKFNFNKNSKRGVLDIEHILNIWRDL